MRICLIALLTATINFFSFPSFCQTIEKITFDVQDSTAGSYLAIRPQSNQIKGVMVLLTSFLPPEALLPETKLHNVAYVNDLLMVVTSMQQKLYADSIAVSRINHILNDIVKRFSVDTSRFAL